MPFVVEPDPEIAPVTEDEVVRPTRVVWRHLGGRLASRIFPTEARARAFAGTLAHDVVALQPASEPPPPQESPPPRKFAGERAGVRTAIAILQSRSLAPIGACNVPIAQRYIPARQKQSPRRPSSR